MTTGHISKRLESIIKDVTKKAKLAEPRTWSIVILDSQKELHWLAEWAQYERIKTALAGIVFCLDYLALRKVCPNQEEFLHNDVVGLLNGTASTTRLSQEIAAGAINCGYKGFFVPDLAFKIAALQEHLSLPPLVLPVSVLIIGAEEDEMQKSSNGYCFIHRGHYQSCNIDPGQAQLWWEDYAKKPQSGYAARSLALKQLGIALTSFGLKTAKIPIEINTAMARTQINPVEAITKLMHRFPRSFLDRQKLRLLRIKHYLHLGKITAAESLVKKMGNLEPKAPDVQVSAGVILWYKGQLQSALKCMTMAQRLAPGEGLIYCFKGEIYREMGLLKQSEQLIRHSIRLNPKDAGAWLALVKTVEERQGPAAATAVFEDAKATITPDAALFNKVGLCYSDQGLDDKALKCYEQALLQKPNDPSILANQGLILGRQGKVKAALGNYEQALRLKPNDAHLLNNKGFCLGQLERYVEALRCYEKAIIGNSNKTDLGLIHNKATCLSKLGRYKEALACYDLVLEYNPADTITLNNRGLCLLSLGRIETALKCYATALHLEPGNGVLWGNKGACLFKQGRYKQALEAYEQAIKLTPAELAYYSGKGMCLDYLGREEEAIACYNKALKMV